MIEQESSSDGSRARHWVHRRFAYIFLANASIVVFVSALFLAGCGNGAPQAAPARPPM